MNVDQIRPLQPIVPIKRNDPDDKGKRRRNTEDSKDESAGEEPNESGTPTIDEYA